MGDNEAQDQALPGAAAETASSMERELRAARELLGMEIAWIAEFSEGKKVFRTVDGDHASFGFSEGDSMPLGESYCQRVVLGAIPNAIPDTSRHDGVRNLAVTALANIGAYIGVPIQLRDGTVYGTLCAASHRPNQSLSERDVEFLRGISRRLASYLEGRRLSDE